MGQCKKYDSDVFVTLGAGEKLFKLQKNVWVPRRKFDVGREKSTGRIDFNRKKLFKKKFKMTLLYL